jgi:hypothetical protein
MCSIATSVAKMRKTTSGRRGDLVACAECTRR